MRLVVSVGFLNEERYLPAFLETVAAQTRLPDRLLLVDDGSTDSSPEIVAEFAAAHEWASVMTRPPRPPERDRLAQAHEYQAFLWAAERIEEPHDVVAKMDADLRLNPHLVEAVMAAFEAEPRLGIAGGPLSIETPAGLQRERSPADHVRGPNKFYRRACLDEILPVPAIAGWEAIDEAKAHMRGWQTRTVELPGGDTVHLRPTGAHDGRVRGFRRMGSNAWSYGAHPLAVALGGVSRVRERPPVLAGVAFVWGWAYAALKRYPRADPDVRAVVRREQLARIRGYFGRRAESASAANASDSAT
ncbi:MAG TPA: glycosyltransferase family A protein [Thermoleophilaceae bacterium]|nr:glycosyltransferase family A protein [Thermoleophilaceae bacterium]